MKWMWAALLAMAVGGTAFSQTTAPASRPVNPNEELPLPQRRAGAGGAAATQSSATSGDPFDIKRVGIALAVVLVMIFVGQKMLKRYGAPLLGKGAGVMQIVSRLPVGPKQQIMLLRVGKRCVVVANTGTQMNRLCEVSDPEEVAVLLGQNATEHAGSSTVTFNQVLDGEQGRFEEAEAAALHAAATPSPDAQTEAGAEGAALDATQQEIGGLLQRLRSLSKQFSKR